jgi:hypothetical protein
MVISPIATGRKQWQVHVGCYAKHDLSELSRHSYGPFKHRWIAAMVGWSLSWDSCGGIICNYWTEEVPLSSLDAM